jgi:hypothetical protein
LGRFLLPVEEEATARAEGEMTEDVDARIASLLRLVSSTLKAVTSASLLISFCIIRDERKEEYSEVSARIIAIDCNSSSRSARVKPVGRKLVIFWNASSILRITEERDSPGEREMPKKSA